MMDDPREALRRAKAAASALSPGDVRAAERLAQDLADLPTLLSLRSEHPHDDQEWAVHELESLHQRHPESTDIAAAFARSLINFAEHDQAMAAVERKMRRLRSLAARHLTDERIRAGVASSLSNIALSHKSRGELAPLSAEAGRRLEAIVDEYPHDSRLAPHLALLLQDRIRATSDANEKAAAIRRINELALLHPGDQTIASVRNLVRGGQQAQGGCYVATAVYGSYDCPEVWVLRHFRDRSLAKSRTGRLAIRTYYATSPMLVRLVGERRWFATSLRRPLDALVAKLGRAGFEATPYTDAGRSLAR